MGVVSSATAKVARRLALAGLALASLATAPVIAQEAMTERVYAQLEQAHTALGEGRFEEVLQRLRQIESARLNDYEKALVNQTYGFLYTEQENYAAAVDYFERSLAMEALPEAAAQGMLYSLAGLYTATGQSQRAIDSLLRWLPSVAEPPGEAYIMLATAYSDMELWRDAAPWAKKAVEAVAEPPESWFQLLVGLYFESGDYAGAATTLREMVGRWPLRFAYWEMLSGAYQRLGDDLRAMAALRLAYREGLLVDPEKILDLVRLMLYVRDPWQAGQLLDAEIRRGRVAADRGHLELLLDAWVAAREFDRAIAVIDRLAPLVRDGRFFVQKAQMLAERGDWSQVIPAAEQAIVRGGLRKPGEAYLLKGVAEAELGRYRDAVATLGAARNYDDVTRRQADGWIAFVRDRMSVAGTG